MQSIRSIASGLMIAGLLWLCCFPAEPEAQSRRNRNVMFELLTILLTSK